MAATVYTFRDAAPEVLERAADQTVSMEAYRDGALVAPSEGTLEILDRSGSIVVGPRTVSIVDSVAQVQLLAADLPETLPLGEGWRLRWVLQMPDGRRIKQREAALARFRLHPPLPEADIVTQAYPDIVQALGRYATNLQGFLDGAWGYLIRALWRVGAWPDLIVSQSDLYDPLYHLTCVRVASFLHRLQPSESYWARERDHHQERFDTLWASLTVRWDRDQDGRVDTLTRESVTTSYHINVQPVRRLPRNGKW